MKIRKKYLTVIFTDYKKHVRIGSYDCYIAITKCFSGLMFSVQCGYKYYSKTF